MKPSHYCWWIYLVSGILSSNKKLYYTFYLLLAFKVTKPQDQIMRFQSPMLTLADTELPPPKKIKRNLSIFEDKTGVCISYPLEGTHGVPQASPKSWCEKKRGKNKAGVTAAGMATSLVQQEQHRRAPRLGWLEMSKQACPLAAGTIELRAIAKCKETMTLAVSTGGSWLKLPWHSAACYAPLEVKFNLAFVCILTTVGFFWRFERKTSSLSMRKMSKSFRMYQQWPQFIQKQVVVLS